MVMVGYGLDRGGPMDSETTPNSFLTKINGKGFWLFATDMMLIRHISKPTVEEVKEAKANHSKIQLRPNKRMS